MPGLDCWSLTYFIILLMSCIKWNLMLYKDTTDAPKWANYLRVAFYKDGRFHTARALYNKCDDFDFPIVNSHM